MASTFDWASSIKPLLAASYNNFNFNPDIFKIARSIESTSSEILNHDAAYEQFYSSFVALSTHFICFNSPSVPKTQMASVLSASTVLVDFILSRLEKQYDQSAVSTKQYVLLLKGLCKGFGCLQKSDTMTLTAVLKSSQFPPKVRSTVGSEKAEEEREAPSKVRSRSPSTRVDPLADVLDCLSTPLSVELQPISRSSKEKSPKEKKDGSSSEQSKDYREVFMHENIQYLMRKNAGSLLMDVCLKLPFLARFSLMTRDLFQGNVAFPTSVVDCHAIQDSYSSLRTDVAIVAVIVALPLLEPLSQDRLQKLCNLGCSCLLAACSVVVSHRVLCANETVESVAGQELEGLANRIVEKSLFVFSSIVNSIQNSNNTGGTQLQNCRFLGSWCLLAGISHVLKTFEIDSSVVVLGHQLLTLLKPILADLKIDPIKAENLNEINVNTVSTSWQKIRFLNRHVKFVNVILEMASESFSKAISLRRTIRTKVETQTKETPANQPLLDIDHGPELSPLAALNTSNAESVDGEPLLGNWLEELLASVPQLVDSASALHAERHRLMANDAGASFGNKDDPNMFSSLAVNYLAALNDHIFAVRGDKLNDHLGFSWSERELAQLANMIRLFEKQCSTNGTDASLVDLNAALIKLMHNLLANELLSEANEASLLSKLDIFIGTDVKDAWPLRITPRILSILGQILLLRHSKERNESSKGDIDGVIVNIWQRFIETLKKNVFVDQDSVDLNDVNVDHLQLLLLIFHSLPLMQKKAVLLSVSSAILQVTVENRTHKKLSIHPSTHFARILLIFDYLIRYFYEPPPALLDQVKSNIFPLQSRCNDGYEKNVKSSLMMSTVARIYFPCAQLEESYLAATPVSQQTKLKPLFYNVAPDISCCDVPKLDGLAASFLLNSSEYNDVYECLFEILSLDRICQLKTDGQQEILSKVAASYVSSIIWRIVGILPPSVAVMQRLAELKAPLTDDKLLFCLLRVDARLSDASFANWIKDGLHKQKIIAEDADALVAKVASKLNSTKLIVDLLTDTLKTKLHAFSKSNSAKAKDAVYQYSFTELLMTDLILCRLYYLLSSLEKEADLNETVVVLQKLTAKYLNLAKFILVENATSLSMDPLPDSETARNSILKLMSISTPGISSDRNYDFGSSCWMHVHSSMRTAISDWNREDYALCGFPAFASAERYADQLIPGESFMYAAFQGHMRVTRPLISQMVGVRQLISSSVSFLIHVVRKFRPSVFDVKACENSLMPLLLDITTYYLSDEIHCFINEMKFYPAADEEKFLFTINRIVFAACYDLLLYRCGAKDNSISPNIIDVMISYLETLLDKTYGCEAIVDVLEKSGDVSVFLRTAFTPAVENEYAVKLVRLFNAIFKAAASRPNHRGINGLCEKIIHSLILEIGIHEKWLAMQFASDRNDDRSALETRTFLEELAKFLNRSACCESVELSKVLLDTLIPLFGQMLFAGVEENGGVRKEALCRRVSVELFPIMVNLASVGSALGQVTLLKAVQGWLQQMKSLFSKDVVRQDLAEKDIYFVNVARVLCDYIAEALSLYRPPDSTQCDVEYDSDLSCNELEQETSEDVAAQADDDDSCGEDSEEETLDSKLCTFTVTQKEFMNQHWYHCHTCGMVDGEGVCTVCAKVCHKGHDLSYSKFGSFFCDCGAKGTCQATSKRSRTKVAEKPMQAQSSRSKYFNLRGEDSKQMRLKNWTASSSTNAAQIRKDIHQNRKLVYFTGTENCRDAIYNQLATTKKDVVECVVEILKFVSPVVADSTKKLSTLGAAEKMAEEVRMLHTAPKTVDMVDSLAVATLGSQDGAFENVKLNLTGDVGQTIKHLVTSHVIQRVAMVCMSNSEHRKQLLAVAHDRSKVTILHVSSLLKQAEGNQKKMTLTRSCSETLPFVVLSLAENPLTDEFLTVCGFKEVHVLTLSHSGTVVDRLVLQPPLEGGNYVLKALWLPNSLTLLAVITADYVRIYDLAESSTQPIFHFMLAVGKISDATFVCWERKMGDQVTVDRHLMLFSNSGHLYGQQLSETCDYAIHGAFYITNTHDLRHPDISENSGIVAQGGSSIYFSCKLQMIFVSFANGKSFCFPFTRWTDSIDCLFPLSWRSSLKSANPQPLFHWSETADHPGLVTALAHTSQNPIIFMIKPSYILAQEVVIPSKAKVIDATPIRYLSSFGDKRTSLLLLGEDGSLKILSFNTLSTDFWLPKPCVVSFSSSSDAQPQRNKRIFKPEKLETQPFAVDYFETCTPMNDVEFGGNDLLQMYNVQLLKERLNTSGLYVACAKATGFQLEIVNNDGVNVFCGVRIEFGKRIVEKTPTYFEIFGRRQAVVLTRGRWYDFPLTREETIAAGNKLTITFGPSRDESGVGFLDSVKVYGKTRDAFGWPEDMEEYASTAGAVDDAIDGSVSSAPNWFNATSLTFSSKREILSAERMLTSTFDVLESYFCVFSSDLTAFHANSMDLSNRVMVTTLHPETLRKAKHVLRRILTNKAEYYSSKDSFILSFVTNALQTLSNPVDPEFYCLLVSLSRGVVTNRPAVISSGCLEPLKTKNFVELLVKKFWMVYDELPLFPSISPVGSPVLFDCAGLIRALVEVMHSICVADLNAVPDVSKCYASFLFSKHLNVAFACRAALVSLFRKKHSKKRVFIPTPPRSVTARSTTDSAPSSAVRSGAAETMGSGIDVSGAADDSMEQNFELINAAMNEEEQQDMFPNADDADVDEHGQENLFDLPAEIDDEQQLVEIAIALSLQEHAADQHGAVGQHADLGYALVAQQQDILDQGHSSDTTASGMSDEEGSNAATEGSTLRISPAEERQPEPAGSVESESAGSGAESVSGRSSTFGESIIDPLPTSAVPQQNLPSHSQHVAESDVNDKHKNQLILVALVDNFTHYFAELDKYKGIQCISFLQVVVTLVGSVNVFGEDDKKVVSRLIQAVLRDLRFADVDSSKLSKRTQTAEVDLLRLRLLSVFLSKIKGKSKGLVSETDMFIASNVAHMLAENGAISYCLRILKDIVRNSDSNEKQPEHGSSKVLVCHSGLLPPDLAPIFLRPYVKEHAGDVFESYNQLITEMALRLPYQIKKVSTMCFPDRFPEFDEQWNNVLCDFMRSNQSSYIKKQVRKLLLFICGSKEKYRCLRDMHTLHYHSDSVQQLCANFTGCASRNEIDINRKLMMDYLTLNNMMDHLKSCVEIASSRTVSWQQFCISSKNDLLYFLKLSCVVDDNMASVVLSLLHLVLGSPENKENKDTKKSRPTNVGRREEKEKFKFSEKIALQIAEYLLSPEVLPLFEKVLKYFLLTCNASECRWQMHSIVQAIFEITPKANQVLLLNLFWEHLWPECSKHGRKASQFIDLLGFYTAKLTPYNEMQKLSLKVLDLLKKQNRMLTDHPNSYLYNALSSLLEFDGYYLENNPCLVCNNPEVPMANIKLTSIKTDARYTTTSQMLKLTGSHEIAKIVLKISDVRRPKTVKRLKLYYSNKTVPSAVELKNKPDLWCLAKTFTLTQNQTELKMEFAVPIVACNLMMEYSEFYETATATAETLHCPRCSASVPAHPGVCNNCSENVYQCHKCRAINYDEKDPFLCNSCGFSKYAKFDYTIYGRLVAGVESIENEEDRKKSLNHINSLLEKADQLFHQLLASRPQIEAALSRTIGQDTKAVADGIDRVQNGADAAASLQGLGGSLVSRNIQNLAYKYNRDCRTAFEELSKVVQKIIANRAELVEFDRRQRELAGLPALPSSFESVQASSDCFGCAAATAQQCILLVRSMASSAEVRQMMASDTDLMNELIEVALKQGSVRARQAARDLVCGIIKDQKIATILVCNKIETKVTKAISENWSPTTMASLVQAELQLLFATLQLTDECWETRVRCVFKLFIQSLSSGAAGMESVTLPCLNMIQWLIAPPLNGEKSQATADQKPKVNVFAWLKHDVTASTFADFMRKRQKTKTEDSTKKADEAEARKRYLMEKYGARWLKFAKVKSERNVWLERLLFCLRSAQMRAATGLLLETMCAAQPMRKAYLLDLLTKRLSELEQMGDRAQEFALLYENLIQDERWKHYLVVRKILPRLGQMILTNVEKLNKFEGKSLNTGMSQGFSLKILCNLLLSFFQVENIRKRYKKQLLGIVLHSYIGLKRLLIQRTKLIDDAQTKLLTLLELLTTGNEKETEEFMTICIETAKKYPLDDMRTPLFVFERLCSTIFPEEKEVGDFLINVEKDAAQEDFLQGRMMGNPYSSTDAGMGPLMREIKNKICRDCDLISLLEDDTGMELLVNGKIISLDLPVAEVYKKIWQPQHGGDPMLIVYRMRGLLGDATEEFIESLDKKKSDKSNDEDIYRLSCVVGRCGGLEVMLERMKSVKNVVHGGTMLSVLLTLFDYCVRVRENRVRLFDPKLSSVSTFFCCLKATLSASDVEVISLAEKTLNIINHLLADSECVSEDQFSKFCDVASASDDDFRWLLSNIHSVNIQNASTLKNSLMLTIANMMLGSQRRTAILLDYFKIALNFDRYESDASAKLTTELDSLCLIANHIQSSKIGCTVKDSFISGRFVECATSYLINRCPPLFKVGLTIDSPDWKDFLARQSLKFILRLLAGLCKNHEPTQLLVAVDCIPIIHRLEQISSEERLGSLAENLMEALKSNPKVAKKIEDVREETKTKKKNLAMAMRQKQLCELGMKISDKGLVRVESASAIKNANDINEEPGLTCSICREGYKFAPQKLLGIYTFTKRCNCEEWEIAARKSPAYSTVTHFNVVHFECHLSAVRSARGRDEWESAMLHNANTKCNGLLPVCGSQVSDADFANGLAKHNAYVQEHTGFADINFVSTIHDLKLLLLRFAKEKSFSEETGGGGRESNIHLIPYLASLSYYMLSQTQIFEAQMAKFNAFVAMPPENWFKNTFECEGSVYYTTLSVIVCCPKDWYRFKLNLLKRLIVTAQIRYVSPDGKNFDDRSKKEYSVYRPYLLFFALVDAIYRLVLKEVKTEKSSDWAMEVQQHMRSNDSKLLESTTEMLKQFENDLLQCDNFMEFCDLTGLLPLIPEPDQFFASALEAIPLV